VQAFSPAFGIQLAGEQWRSWLVAVRVVVVGVHYEHVYLHDFWACRAVRGPQPLERYFAANRGSLAIVLHVYRSGPRSVELVASHILPAAAAAGFVPADDAASQP